MIQEYRARGGGGDGSGSLANYILSFQTRRRDFCQVNSQLTHELFRALTGLLVLCVYNVTGWKRGHGTNKSTQLRSTLFTVSSHIRFLLKKELGTRSLQWVDLNSLKKMELKKTTAINKNCLL